MSTEKARQLEAKLKDLANEIVTDPDKLKEFSQKWNNGFHNYSFGNTLLIWFQKPESTLCAGYHTWLDHKRYVKRGEHGISILAPVIIKTENQIENEEGELETVEEPVRHFKVVTVFDVSQTDGEPLEIGHSDKITGETSLTVEEVSDIFGFPVEWSNGLANGSTDGKTIQISERDNRLAMLATYFHELGHFMLHFDKEGKQKDIAREVKELEAEAVSYIVCTSLGIDDQKSKYYIGHWHGDKETLGRSGERIIKTAEKIIRQIEKAQVPAGVA